MGRATKIGMGLCLATMSFAAHSSATVSMLAYDADRDVLGAVVISCLGESSSDFHLSEVVRLNAHHGGVVAQSYFFEEGRDTVLGALVAGKTAAQALLTVTNADFDPSGVGQGYMYRQYGAVDTQGGHSAFTGNAAHPFALHIHATQGAISYVIAGNYLTDTNVVTTLSQGFSESDTHLAERFARALSSLLATGGGDSRCSPRTSDAGYASLVFADGSTWEQEVKGQTDDPAALLIATLAEQEIVTLQETPPPMENPPPMDDPQNESHSSNGCQLANGPSLSDKCTGWLAYCLLLLVFTVRQTRQARKQ